MSLVQTHDTVENKFLHGPDRGNNVEDLTRDLVAERVRPSKLTTLVGTKVHGKVHVVYGNRRLEALKETCAHGMHIKSVAVIAHKLITAGSKLVAVVLQVLACVFQRG